MQHHRERRFEALRGPPSSIGRFRMAFKNALDPSDTICNGFNSLPGPIQCSQHNILRDLLADSELLALTRLGPFSVIGHCVLKHLGAHSAPSEVFAWLSRMYRAHPMPSVIIFSDLPRPIPCSQHDILREPRADPEKSEPLAPTYLGPCSVIGSSVLKRPWAHLAPSEVFA